MQKIIFESESKLLSFFDKYVGKNLLEISKLLDDEIFDAISHNKGMVGQIFEGLTGRKPNTYSEPDIKELNIDLKVLPLKKVNNILVSKERSKLTSANYKKILNDDWNDTYLRKKIDKILFNAYYHPSGSSYDNLEDFIFKGAFIFHLDERIEKDTIKSDWLRLKKKVCQFKAHSISEKMFRLLSASTSGTGRLQKYHSDAKLAKERSHSFKNGYLTSLWKEQSHPCLPSIDTGGQMFDSFIFKIIKNTFEDKTIGELEREFGLSLDTNAKNLVNLLLKKVMNVNDLRSIREIDENELEIKTVPINPNNGTPWESMSFPKMSLKDFAHEEWDGVNNDSNHEASLKVELEKNFIFLPIIKKKVNVEGRMKFEDRRLWRFGKVTAWKPDEDMLDGIRKEWESCKKMVVNDEVETWKVEQKLGKIIQKNNLLKSSTSKYIHIRPHTSDSSNLDLPYLRFTNEKISICWQSFWLNKSFLKEVINH